MRIKLLSLAALFSGLLTASAAVTVQGWWPYGEGTSDTPDVYGDISGNTRRFSSAYSSGRTGNAGTLIIPYGGCGGPLGTSAYVSTNCLLWNSTRDPAAGMWDPGYNPPAVNYAIELWALPEWPGSRGGNGAWLFCSGQGGGVRFVITNDDTSMVIRALINGNNVQIGDILEVNTNRWTHLAVVNQDGTNTFYVNGVQYGPSAAASENTVPSGIIFGGSAPGTQPTFNGYLDELRISTFGSGEFRVSDLFTRPIGPSVLRQPKDASVNVGGAAAFEVIAAVDYEMAYQWRKNGENITGANRAVYSQATVAAGDNGAKFDVVMSSAGLSVTSSVAMLTVLSPSTPDLATYQNKVKAEPSLLAYFPVDGDTGATVTNVKDNTHNGTIEGPIYYDGRTNTSFGLRGLGFPSDGDVMVPNNPAFDFTSGSGTIEAIVYMNVPTLNDPALVTVGDYGGMYYLLGLSRDGFDLIYSNDFNGGFGVSWPLSEKIVGKKVHLAFVFENGTKITPYVNGEALATKTQEGFGFAAGYPLYIGGRGAGAPGFSFNGTIDEVAIYSAALPSTSVQSHYASFIYGTNTAPPSVAALPASKTLLAGGSPVMKVTAGGTPPFTYQWTSNGVDIAGATSATLALEKTTPAFSADYGVKVANQFGTVTSDPITLTFVPSPAGYPAAVLNDNPIAYWRQNETSGTTLLDSAGFFDGTYSGAVTLGQPGALPGDAAVAYTGGNGVIPWSAALNPNGPFSIEMWVKSLDNSAYRTMVSAQNRNSGRSGYALYHHVNVESFESHVGDATTVTMFTYGPDPVALDTWYHVVLSYDGSQTTLYVDGKVSESTDTPGTASGSFNPNTAMPLTFGQRTDGAWPNNGLIDEVAFYNRALTSTEVSNHWKFVWTAAAITTQPASVTANEWSTVEFTGAASGIPNTYVWTKNGVPLTAGATNPDGSAKYPNGVTGTTLQITQAHPADAGQYRMVANNPVGNATSDPATLTVAADTQAPIIDMAAGLGTPNVAGSVMPFLLKVVFNEAVEEASATLAANYQVSGGVVVDTAKLSVDKRTAFLTTSGMTAGQTYTVTVNGIKDQAQTPNTQTSAKGTFIAPVLTPGVILWDYYYPVVGEAHADRIANLDYLTPATNAVLAMFDSTLITKGDLNTAGFGVVGENYVANVSGWVTPAVTTNYVFFLASDDASELWLSANADPANATMIAVETGCCHGFQEPGAETTSGPVPLEAGKSYFIRAVMSEGGGGDYVKVAWRMEGDTTASTSLTPIPGQYLSAYANVPPPEFGSTSYNAATGQLTINWSGLGTLQQSEDLVAWENVPGNPASPYTVTIAPGVKFYRLRQ